MFDETAENQRQVSACEKVDAYLFKWSDILYSRPSAYGDTTDSLKTTYYLDEFFSALKSCV